MSGVGTFQPLGLSELEHAREVAEERQRIEQEKWDGIISIVRRGARDAQDITKARSNWEKLNAQLKGSFLLKTAANLTGGLSRDKRKVCEINKAAAIAGA